MIDERQIEGHRALVIGSAELEASFVPDAGMVCCSLQHGGEELLGQRNGLDGYVERLSTMGIPLLYPWANRLGAERFECAGRTVDLRGEIPRLKRDGNGLPIHGLLTAAPGWQFERHEELEAGARLAAGRDWGEPPAQLDAYPFPHRLGIEARVRGAALTIATTIEPTADVAVPVAFGFHPYLAPPGASRSEWRIELPVVEQLELDGRGLPSGRRGPVEPATGPLGERSFDDLYAAPPAGAAFAVGGGGRRIELKMDAAYPFVQIYAPADAGLIAIEPMTAPTDALARDDAPTVAPGESFRAEFTISVAG